MLSPYVLFCCVFCLPSSPLFLGRCECLLITTSGDGTEEEVNKDQQAGKKRTLVIHLFKWSVLTLYFLICSWNLTEDETTVYFPHISEVQIKCAGVLLSFSFLNSLKAVTEYKQIFLLLNDMNYSWLNEYSFQKYIPPFSVHEYTQLFNCQHRPVLF